MTNGAIRSADVEVFTRQILAQLGEGLALSANPRESIRAVAAATLAFRRTIPPPSREEAEARLEALSAKPVLDADEDDGDAPEVQS